MSQKEDEAEKAKKKAIAESIIQGKLNMTFLKGATPQKTSTITRYKKPERQYIA